MGQILVLPELIRNRHLVVGNLVFGPHPDYIIVSHGVLSLRAKCMVVFTRRCVGGLPLYIVFLQDNSGRCLPNRYYIPELVGSHICANKTKKMYQPPSRISVGIFLSRGSQPSLVIIVIIISDSTRVI